MNRPVLIANASGFYGDRVAAMREVIEGGPVDVVTGDYLAELTMLILWKAKRKDPSAGYAKTFLTQLDQVLGPALDRRIKIVVNAGGLNPSGLAEQAGELAARLGLHPKIAWIDGDDLSGRIGELTAAGHDLAHLDTGQPLRGAGVEPVTANAYLGGWGIAEALAAGADLVICPRVTDASLVVGSAAWWHGWARDDFDALAGAVAAGHVIECGPQATGGNYPWPADSAVESPAVGRPGYPIAEVAADGASVITKHPGSGGFVSTGTVTAQLLYEIGEPGYANPDVVAHFDTIRLTDDGPNRVRISGTGGSAPSGSLKVAINYAGGYRNTMTLVLTGLDIESKAAAAQAQLFDLLGGKERFDQADVRLLRFDRPDAPTNAQATAHLQITVKDRDRALVGRAFSNAAVELYLGGYAGFHTTTPPTDATEFGVYWPTLIPADLVTQRVTLPNGTTRTIAHTPAHTPAAAPALAPAAPAPAASAPAAASAASVRSIAAAPALAPAAPAPAASAPAAASAASVRSIAAAPALAPAAPAATPATQTSGLTTGNASSTISPDRLARITARSGELNFSAGTFTAHSGQTPSGIVNAEITARSAGAGETVRAPLGLVCGARSGDKGGIANVGLWTRVDREYAWLREYLTVERFRELLTEAADLPVHRYELPNLRAVNFVVVGLLGDGVASATRPDPQAKGLGEYIRSRYVDLPAEFAR